MIDNEQVFVYTFIKSRQQFIQKNNLVLVEEV